MQTRKILSLIFVLLICVISSFADTTYTYSDILSTTLGDYSKANDDGYSVSWTYNHATAGTNNPDILTLTGYKDDSYSSTNTKYCIKDGHMTASVGSPSYFKLEVAEGYKISNYSCNYSRENAKISGLSNGTNINVGSRNLYFNIEYTIEGSYRDHRGQGWVIPSSFSVNVSPIKYIVSFNANEGDGNMTKENFEYGVTKALTTNSFTRTGYTFTGWNTKTDGTGTSYANEADGSKLTTKDGGTVTLYAQWTANAYTVAFNGNDATSGSMDPQSFTYDVAQNLTKNAFTKTGYIFDGWKDGNGTTYTDGQSVSNLTSEKNGKVTLTAQWKSRYALTSDNKNVKVYGSTVTDTEIAGAHTFLASADNVNSLVYVEEASYTGTKSNVVVNNDGSYTCADLVLTDRKEASLSVPIAFTASKVTYERPSSSGTWGTIYLPYAPIRKSGYTFYKLMAADLDAGKLTFTSVDGDLAPNTPYLFKNTKGSNFVSSSDDNVSISVEKTTEGNGTETQFGNWSMKGVYERTTIYNSASSSVTYAEKLSGTSRTDGDSYYIKADGSGFVVNDDYFYLSAFRAYFSCDVPAGQAKPSFLTFSVDDDFATGVKMIEDKASGTVDMIFDLSGRRLNEAKKGINIINGKKVLVK